VALGPHMKQKLKLLGKASLHLLQTQSPEGAALSGGFAGGGPELSCAAVPHSKQYG